MEPPLLFKQESFLIRAACFEVYREKGCGFAEQVYHECLQIELRLQGVPYISKKPLKLEYKSCPLQCTYEPDFICFDRVILEIKSVKALADEHRAQVQNYLRATGLQLGMLVNFGHYPKVEIERIVMSRGRYKTSLPAQTTNG